MRTVAQLQAAPRPDGRKRQPYIATLEKLNLAIGATDSVILTPATSEDVVIERTMAVVTDAATDAQILSAANVLVEYEATGLGTMTKRPAPLSALAGDARQPYEWGTPLGVAGGASFENKLTNKHTAAVNVRIVHVGYKLVA